MTKRELLDYLRQVRDAENARNKCLNNLRHLRAQKAEFSAPEKPTRRVYTPYQNDGWDKIDAHSSADAFSGGCLAVFFYIGFPIAGFVLGLQSGLSTAFLYAVLGLIASVIAVLLIGNVVGKSAVKRHHKKALRQAERQADRDYQRDCSTYSSRLAAYQRATAPIDKKIQTEEAVLQSIEFRLASLYVKNIIHVNFRNYSAVKALLSYLEMGACDTLEGPNGAYALYLRRH